VLLVLKQELYYKEGVARFRVMLVEGVVVVVDTMEVEVVLVTILDQPAEEGVAFIIVRFFLGQRQLAVEALEVLVQIQVQMVLQLLHFMHKILLL
jgi:hypothetical protein